MANNWQENSTWKSGLLEEIPVSRWQEIRGSDSVGIVILKKRRGDLPLHPTNLQYQQTLSTNTSSSMMMPFFNAGQFVCIAVDMRRRPIDLDCSFTTADHVQGSLKLRVTYQVIDAKAVVVDIEDVIDELVIRCRGAVRDFSETRSYKSVSSQGIKEAVRQSQVDDLGLVIKQVTIPDSIVWPANIVEPMSKILAVKADAELKSLTNKIKIEAESEYSKLLEKKLSDMGITHPAILMRVLSRHDADYQTILEAAQHFADSRSDSQSKAKDFLVWLIEKDKVPRVELEELISGLVGRVTDDVTALPDAVASFLIAPSKETPQISDSSSAGASSTRDADRIRNEGDVRQEQTVTEQIIDQESDTSGHSIIRRRPPRNLSDSTAEGDHSYTRHKRNPKK